MTLGHLIITIGITTNYVHQNPVEAGFVFRAEDYKYSSAKDYSGENGLLEDVIAVK